MSEGHLRRPRSTPLLGCAALAQMLLVSACSPPEVGTAEEVFEKSYLSVVKVYGLSSAAAGSRAGTGFTVLSEGKLAVVTNRHVVESSDVAVVESPQGIWSAPRWREHPYLDIALIDLPSGVEMPALHLGSASSVAPGRKVYTVGHPLGESIAIQEGIVSSLEGGSLVFSAPLSTGASGSPLLEASGNVIGLCHSFVENAQNYNLALPIDFVQMPAEWKVRHPREDEDLGGYLRNISEVKASSRRSISSWEGVSQEYPEWKRWVDETNLTRRPLVQSMEAAVSAARAVSVPVFSATSAPSVDCALSELLEKNAAALEKSWKMHTSNLKKSAPLRPIPLKWGMLSDDALVPEMVASLRGLSRLLSPLAPHDPDQAGLESAILLQLELEGRWSLGLVP